VPRNQPLDAGLPLPQAQDRGGVSEPKVRWQWDKIATLTH